MSALPQPRLGPTQRPRGTTRQDYATPEEFIAAVEKRFGVLAFDLACTQENRKAPCGYYFPEEDALTKTWWSHSGNLWLNPPFANIEPWAEKLASECRNRPGLTFFLTPASIGTDWFSKHVMGKAVVLGLSPLLTFEGCDDPYPKDLMLSVYGYGLHGFDTWRWNQ